METSLDLATAMWRQQSTNAVRLMAKYHVGRVPTLGPGRALMKGRHSRLSILLILLLVIFVASGGASTRAQNQDLAENLAPAGWSSAWPKTNFEMTSIDFGEVADSGPGRDGVVSVIFPEFRLARHAGDLGAREPVLRLRIAGRVRGYPLRYLIWHEIVNDVVENREVMIVFCSLCGAAAAFDRTPPEFEPAEAAMARAAEDGGGPEEGGRSGAMALTFGATGKIRRSVMIMYDAETESWWDPVTGRGLVGAFSGAALEKLPTDIVSWGAFAAEHPDALVLTAPETATPRPYGETPYVSYDTQPWPFLYEGPPPPFGIEPLARVVRVGETAWPLARLREAETLTEEGYTFTWSPGLASALDDKMIARGRDIGVVTVIDAATGAPAAHQVLFAFTFRALFPNGRWMAAPTAAGAAQ